MEEDHGEAVQGFGWDTSWPKHPSATEPGHPMVTSTNRVRWSTAANNEYYNVETRHILYIDTVIAFVTSVCRRWMSGSKDRNMRAIKAYNNRNTCLFPPKLYAAHSFISVGKLDVLFTQILYNRLRHILNVRCRWRYFCRTQIGLQAAYRLFREQYDVEI